MNRRLFLGSLAALGFAFRSSARAEEREKIEGPMLEQLLADMSKARKGLKTMRSSFTQERTMKLFATTIKSTGRFHYVAPDRLRWELDAPDDVTYWVGPEGLSYRTKSSSATRKIPRATCC